MSLVPAPTFQALVVPHRSLSRKGMLVVISAIMLLNAAVAARFWLIGAWPVVACSAFEVPLIILLLAINVHRARASELILLNAEALTIVRTDSRGRRQQIMLPAAWLRVDLECGPGIPRVMLSTHGRGCEVGAFLHEPNRRSLFEALQSALHSLRNPVFDNPQLRDDGF